MLGANTLGDSGVMVCMLGHSVTSDSMRPYGLWPARLLRPRDSPGKNTGVDCHILLQGIVLTQGSNQHLLHCTQILDPLSHLGSPAYPKCTYTKVKHCLLGYLLHQECVHFLFW